MKEILLLGGVMQNGASSEKGGIASEGRRVGTNYFRKGIEPGKRW